MVNRKVLEEYGPLPSFSEFIVNRIMENSWMPNKPNHLLVNEYNAGQGIMPHIGTFFFSMICLYRLLIYIFKQMLLPYLVLSFYRCLYYQIV
jgi:hypothetical protein